MGKTIKFTINGREAETTKGKTILQVATDEKIHIPHLCNDVRLTRQDGECGMCVVELLNESRFVKSCITNVYDGMEISTNSQKVVSYRKIRIEQLLSQHNADCVAPCVQACPAHIDIQAYLRQVANGNKRAALRVIKDRNPFPLVCGRVCPHPCEMACRRDLVDSAVAINNVKRFVADKDIESEEPYMPICKPKTGKKIAVVGAGPSGLSAAYYSAINGHSVTVFESQPKAGGMMQYCIPSYRLPKNTLDKEIEQITKLGVKIQTGKAVGVHMHLEDIQKDFDAVYLGIGSSTANTLKLEGDRARGVWLGIAFLERIAKGVNVELGESVVVIGGGNTAIDCARTALRREGVKKVILVYRRTKDEMPAESYEIEEALEEGVEMRFLVSPTKIDFDSESRYVNSISVMKMELGPEDRSGRRRPVPIDGEPEEIIPVTSVIGAIGQSTDASFLWDDMPVKLSRWGDIEINGKTMETSVEKVFSGGDCVTGPATVIQAVASGRQAADCMDDFVMKGYVPERREDYSCSRGSLEDLPRHEFEAQPKIERVKMPTISVEKRAKNFNQIETGLTEEQAISEAERCLKCGCSERNTCNLRDEASAHSIVHKKPLLDLSYIPIVKDHPFIRRDHNKCIACGLCVAVCNDFVGPGVLDSYTENGCFRVGTINGAPLEETACVSCGHCVTACPCGALSYKRESDIVFKALNDPKKIVIGFVAPAVRSVVATHYDLKHNEAMPFLAGILKCSKLGFDKIFDFTFAADLTIMEETTEFLGRVASGKKLPHFTSCCPGWINYVEKKYPELIENLSTCKSPQQMMGSTVKSHYIKWAGLEDRKDDIFVVSIVPCIAKKDEATRKQFVKDGVRDVDAVLTTSELFEMINKTKIDTASIDPQEYDAPYKQVSGAGVLFGVTGGVAEAALRMAVEKITGKPLEKLDFNEVRGLEGIKEVEYDVNGTKVRLAVVNGLNNVDPILEQIKNGEKVSYDLVEVMTCPGGCIDGAGHPKPEGSQELTKRKNIIVALDKESELRTSQDNPDIQKLYEDFYIKPNSDIAHDLLHTTYENRKRDDLDIIQKRAKDISSPVDIKVCVDKSCSKKGSTKLMDEMRAKVKEYKLEQRIKIKPQLCKGHCEEEGIFVTVDGVRISEEKYKDLDFLFKEFENK
jgi:formate dehydrogenase major subunit